MSAKQKDGVFVDCRSHWKGRIGTIAASWSKYQGGTMALGSDGDDFAEGLDGVALRFGLHVVLECSACGEQVQISQAGDPAPKFHFLEEGAVRLGLRIAFDLLDGAGHYHGDGRQDIWLYPGGDCHLTWAVQTVDGAAHTLVRDAYVEVQGEAGYGQIYVGQQQVAMGGEEVVLGFGKDVPDKALTLCGAGGAAGLYWARDQGTVRQMAYDHGALPPFYASRWPTGMEQWSRGQMGWAQNEAAEIRLTSDGEGARVLLGWMRGAEVEEEVTCSATLVASLRQDRQKLGALAAALQQPLVPQVRGGEFRAYTDEDGTYEIGQGDPTHVEVVFPADPLARVAPVRFYRRKTDPRHRGGVIARVDGKKVRCQLMSEGELTDDICVVMEMSHRNDSVDDVLVNVPLKKTGPTVLTIDKVPGIQAVYQSEISGVDLQRRAGNRRDLVVWSSRNGHRPLFELDLFSCAVHRLTQYGQKEPALWEMPMAWFCSCGISKHQYSNFIKDFAVVENGPEAVEIYLRGTNPNQRVQSELWLRAPFDHPRLRLEVRMRLEVLEAWEYNNVEFSDIFPYPSRLVETWFHEGVLFLQRGKSAMVYTYRPDKSFAEGGESDDDQLFYGLFATDRGNVLTLVKNRQHPQHKLHYSVCGNYIDVHVNLDPGPVPVPAGKTYEVEYITELFGDAQTGVDQIRQIGMASLEAGDIVL